MLKATSLKLMFISLNSNFIPIHSFLRPSYFEYTKDEGRNDYYYTMMMRIRLHNEMSLNSQLLSQTKPVQS
jgi:hypothetical protein